MMTAVVPRLTYACTKSLKSGWLTTCCIKFKPTVVIFCAVVMRMEAPGGPDLEAAGWLSERYQSRGETNAPAILVLMGCNWEFKLLIIWIKGWKEVSLPLPAAHAGAVVGVVAAAATEARATRRKA